MSSPSFTMPHPSIFSSNRNDLDIKNFIALSCIGVIVKLFFGTTTTKEGYSGPASAAVWGYGTITLSLIGLLLVLASLGTNKSNIYDYT